MKQGKIVLIIFGVLVVGLFAYGFFAATPKSNGQTQPKIEITPNFYDFGDIEFGTIAKQTFKVKNIGNQPLEIKRVATSCGCTSAEVTKEVINPQEEAELLVTYDTKAMGEGPHGKGQQERIIYVKTNDPNTPQAEVVIKAYVQ